jgi:cysteine sulfinate desulfinase/cysteine desulfurase-like protein
MKKSDVLEAMNVPADVATGFLRLSFGSGTTEAEVDTFLSEWQQIASRVSAKAA